MIPDPYAADEAEVQQQKLATPRSTALLHDVHVAESRTYDLEKRKALESMRGALVLHQSWKEDLSEVGEREYRKRLELITGKASE